MVKVYQGGETMKYEKPEVEVVLFETDDIVRTSDVGTDVGDNTGDWTETP